MLRTVRAIVGALALLGVAGCSSETASPSAEGTTPSAPQTENVGAVAPVSHVVESTPPAVASRPASSPPGSASANSAAPATNEKLSTEEHIARGMKLSEQGRRRDAINAYSAALKQDGRNLAALLYRAGEHYALQEFDAAERDVTQAISLDAAYAEAYVLRAHLSGMKHDYQAAVDDFYTSLKHPERDANFSAYFGDKKDIVAHVYLAAAYSECPDLNFRDDAKAFQHALTACKLDNWQNRRYVSLLVNAIAGSKSQEAAVQRQQEALAVAPNDSVKQQLEVAVEAFDYRSEFPIR